jgi:hypothetical protein
MTRGREFGDTFYAIIAPMWERDIEGVWLFISEEAKSTLRRLLSEDDRAAHGERVDAKMKELGR